ncbi:MAG TPA: MFS transporter [Gammaproteobacteria bacterium]
MLLSKLPGTVIVLGFVSLLNDVASDMIAPLLPIFLATTLGAGPAIVGLIEGVAETTSSLLKLYAGRLGDRGIGHKRLALGGYLISNLTRPLIGIATSWPFVLAMRFCDRIGKGLRTAPRDALIALSTAQEQRGYAFGLHRAMDHTGAMIGPLLAALLLAYGMEMGDVFLASAVPGVLVILLLIFGVKEPPHQPLNNKLPPFRFRTLPHELRRLIIAAGLLALAAVPDAFLVLWLNENRIPVAWIPLLWAVGHGLRALVSLPAGRLSDRIGRLKVMATGWSARVAMLAAMPWVESVPLVILFFMLYAMATAATEGAERALIGDVSASELRGSAFGAYHMTVGLLALPGALWFGVVWQLANMHTAFLLSSLLSLTATLWFIHQYRQR